MSKKASAQKSTKAPIGNLKPKARREIAVRGGLSNIQKSANDTSNAIVKHLG